MDIHRHHFERCESTNHEANRWLKLNFNGRVAVFTAEDQFEGKGQRGSRWEQAPGLDLAWSMAIKWPKGTAAMAMKHEDAWFLINKGVTLAALETVQEALGASPSNLCIKWPNDLFVQNQEIWKKCGGILIENTWQGPSIVGTVIGIGINALSSHLTDTRTSLAEVTGQGPQTEFQPQFLAKQLEKNVLHAIHQWESSISDAAFILRQYQQELTRRFDGRLLGLCVWRVYRWKGVNRIGKITGVDQSGRCLMHWQEGEPENYIQAIDNNKQLKWSWLNRQST